MAEVLERNQLIPCFCPQCRHPDTYERDSVRDILSESGKTMWLRWKCRVCGNTTIRPTENI